MEHTSILLRNGIDFIVTQHKAIDSHVPDTDTRQSPVQMLSPRAKFLVVLYAILPNAVAYPPPTAKSVSRSTTLLEISASLTSLFVLLPAA